jgi:hypothetical protein
MKIIYFQVLLYLIFQLIFRSEIALKKNRTKSNMSSGTTYKFISEHLIRKIVKE